MVKREDRDMQINSMGKFRAFSASDKTGTYKLYMLQLGWRQYFNTSSQTKSTSKLLNHKINLNHVSGVVFFKLTN